MGQSTASLDAVGEVVLEARDIERTYRRGDIAVPVLKDLDLQVRRGEWVACTGRSGSGKSTLLHVLGLLDSADAGTYLLAGHDVCDLDDSARARLRNELLGFVFQLHNLLPRTSALENVATPLIYRGVRRAERLRRARAALEAVGLADRADHDPSQLSGGQMQRVAIARALVGDPEVLLVDEPTGNLDLAATGEVLELLDRLHDEGRTIVMITHEEDVAAHADRRLVLSERQAARRPRDGGIAMRLLSLRRSNAAARRRLGAGSCPDASRWSRSLAGCGSSSKAAATRAPAALGPGPRHGEARRPGRQRDGSGAADLDQEQGQRQGRPGHRAERRAGRRRSVRDAWSSSSCRPAPAAAARARRERRPVPSAARAARRQPGQTAAARATPATGSRRPGLLRPGRRPGRVPRQDRQGTVTAVSAGSNGAVTATITIAKLPAGVTAKYTGIAQIQVKVLASNVLIIPTAAIKGSGGSATVQVLAERQDVDPERRGRPADADRGRDHLGPERRPERRLHAHLHGALPRRARTASGRAGASRRTASRAALRPAAARAAT